MAYVEGYEYDIFVSYAHDDNAGSNWVDNYIKYFKRQMKDCGIQNVEFFLDSTSLSRTGIIIDEIKTAIEKSAMLLIIYSDTYLTRPFCLLEQELFKGYNKQNRLIVIQKSEISKQHTEQTEFNIVKYFGIDFSCWDFIEQTYKLAEDVTQKLDELQKIHSMKTVYLAKPFWNINDSNFKLIQSQLAGMLCSVCTPERSEIIEKSSTTETLYQVKEKDKESFTKEIEDKLTYARLYIHTLDAKQLRPDDRHQLFMATERGYINNKCKLFIQGGSTDFFIKQQKDETVVQMINQCECYSLLDTDIKAFIKIVENDLELEQPPDRSVGCAAQYIDFFKNTPGHLRNYMYRT